MRAPNLYLTSEQSTVLARYRLDHGRTWKAQLRKDWQASTYADAPEPDRPILQQLRNSVHFGPAGLLAWPRVEVFDG